MTPSRRVPSEPASAPAARATAGQRLRVFVSSPGDVSDERRRVELAAERLNVEFKGRVILETVRWETSYYSAHDTFQRQIPEAVDCDVVVAIFRSRLGTELPAAFSRQPSGEPYPSGTAYEVLTAIEARRAGGQLPDIYVFRYPGAPSVSLDALDRADVEAQWDKLKRFFETWFRKTGGEFVAAFQEYGSIDHFAEQIEDCLRQWLARRGFPAPAQAWDRGLRGSPFPGLSPYDASRAAVYFGRGLAVAQAVSRLRRLAASEDPAERPFLLIIGASGAGKSSLLRAGLLPSLAIPGTVPAVDLWRTAVMTPDADPFAALAAALSADEALGPELRAGAFRTPELLAVQLRGPPAVALLPVREALDRAAEARRRQLGSAEARPGRLALGIDQAERLMAEASPEVVARFAGLVCALVSDELALVAMALRSDAYPRFQAFEAFAALRQSGATLDLLLPTQAELEEVVVRPVAACEPPLAFERREGRSLAAVLVTDSEGGDALPLLQLTLSRLYEAEAARGDGIMAFADYRGMAAAVTETGNAALAALGGEARAQLPALIAGLLSDVLNDPASGARIPVVAALDRLGFEAGDPARAALVEAFVSHRLLVSEGVGAAVRLRPVHEALLRIWPQARAIVGEIAHLVQVRHALEPLVRAWSEAPGTERPRHLDLSPALLGGAQQLLDRFPAELPPAMRAFVEASTEAFRRREAAERRRTGRLLAGALAALVIVVVFALAAAWQWRRTEAALVRERAALGIASSRAALRDGRLLAAVRAARQAFEADPAADSRSALFSALTALSPRLSGALRGPAAGTALAWAGPGSVAIGLASGEVELLPTAGRPPPDDAPEVASDIGPAADRAVATVQRLADGRLAALRRDASVLVLASGRPALAVPGPLSRLTADPGSAASIASDPSGERIAVASVEAGLVVLHRGRREEGVRPGGTRVRAVAFSPGGEVLAHGDDDGVVRVSDAEGKASWTIAVGAPVLALAWSHDGRWLAAGTTKGGLSLIDVRIHAIAISLAVADRPVSVLVWSPAGDHVAFNCGHLLVCVWQPFAPPSDISSPEPPVRLNGHQVAIRAAAWSPDGSSLASLDTDGTILLWSMTQDTDVRFALGRATTDEIASLAAGPDGSTVFGGSSRGAVYAWTPLAAPPRRLPAGDGGAVEALALSRDGRLAAARSDGTLSVWTADHAAAPVDMPFSGRLSQAGWAPDGSMLAAIDPDARAVWLARPDARAPPGAEPCRFAPEDARPEGLTWAPRRSRLYVSVHGAVRVCDPDAGWLAPIRTGGDPRVAPMSLSASLDGRWLATTGGDVWANLYDLDSPTAAPRALPTGAGEPVLVLFSPDGLRLAALAADGTLSVWDRASGEVALAFRANLLMGRGDADPDRADLVTAMAWAGDHQLAAAHPDGSVEMFELDADHWQHRLAMLGGSTRDAAP